MFYPIKHIAENSAVICQTTCPVDPFPITELVTGDKNNLSKTHLRNIELQDPF